MLLKALVDVLDVEHQQISSNLEFHSIITDSRRAVKGGLFFAISGFKQDGNSFIEEAIERGVVAVVSEEPVGKFFPIDFIQVHNVRQALAKVSKLFYGSPDESLNLTGVTGTNGKTTVSLLAQYLMGGSQSVGLLGTIRYDIGNRTLPSHRTTPESVDCFSLFSQMKMANCKDVVMEVSSHGIDQHRVDYVHFNTAVFLNLSRDHMDYHESIDAYFEVKKKLFTGALGFLVERAFVNIDCPYGRKLYSEIPEGVKKYSFGTSDSADFWASAVCLQSTGLEFMLNYPEGQCLIRSNLLGRHNVLNLLASLSTSYMNGVPMDFLRARVLSFPGVTGRMERIIAGQDFNIIVDYAHTHDAIQHACEMIHEITKGKKIIVFGCGGERDRGKRPLMLAAAIQGADLVIATSDNPRNEPLDTIFEDMRKGIAESDLEEKVSFIKDRRNAIAEAFHHARSGDCVLIAGKGHEMYQELEGRMIPFDDRKIARELIENRYFKPNNQE